MPEHPRHDIRCAFFRVAAKGGMSREDAVRFVSLLDDFAVNPEHNLSKLREEAQDIYRNIEAGKLEDRKLYGVPFLLSHFGEDKRNILLDIFKLLDLEMPERSQEQSEAAAGIPKGFSVGASGVYFTKEAEDEDPKPFRVCSKLEVTALVQTKDSDEWGLELKWNDLSNTSCTWILPRNLLHNDASAIREELLRRGFQFLEPSKHGKELFVRYLMGCNPPKRKQSVSRVGWHGETYVSPTQVFSANKDEIVFQAATAKRISYSAGTLQEWKDEVAARCVGNSRLLFAVSASFGAALMPFANAESGGINLFGTSSIGKTTGAVVAASVYSNEKYIQQWRATANGLESVAAQYNHALLPLDEIAQADPKEIGETVYLLSNQRGKLRMNRSGVLRTPYEWQLLFLSTGEKDLATHMQGGNTKIKGGQMVRCLDIPGDAGVGYGLFEDLHGSLDGGAFAIALKQAAARYHGTAFPVFIDELLKQGLPKVKEALTTVMERFEKSVAQKCPSGEVYRAIQRFALIAAGGEMASALCVTGWPKNEAFTAAQKCFFAWLNHRGGTGAGDTLHGIRQVRRFLELHGSARFSDLASERASELAYDPDIGRFDRAVTNRAGFRSKTPGQDRYDYFVLAEAFRTEVCAGYDATSIAKALADRNVLIRDKKQLTVKVPQTLPGIGRPRVYHITSKIFELDDNTCAPPLATGSPSAAYPFDADVDSDVSS